jgi:hypothetical protein
MMIIIYSSILINIILGYIIFNLFSKQERLEFIIDNNDKYNNIVSKLVKDANVKLEEVKKEGMIGYDENVEWFYQYVKELQKTFDHITSNSNYD